MKKRNIKIVSVIFVVISTLIIWPEMADSKVESNKELLKNYQHGEFLVSKDNAISQNDIDKGYVEGEVLIKFKKGKINLNNQMGRNKLNTFARNKEIAEKTRIERANLSLFKSLKKTTNELINDIKFDQNVEYVEPNYIYHATSVPNDPDFSKQWGLNNTGQTVNGINGTKDSDIDMPEAWDVLSSKSTSVVKVAVIDSGIDMNHPDLKTQIIDGYDYVDWDNDPQDTDGHGTHVSGIISAVMNNSVGISGFSSKIKIIPIRVLDTNGYTTSDKVASGIYESYDRNAQIVNMSLGGTNYSSTLYNAMSFGDSLYDTIFVVAAGNESNNNDSNPMYPASYDLDNIISVAATDQNDNLADFSNYGSTSVDIAAPGVNIYSTYLNYISIFNEDFDSAIPPSLPATFENIWPILTDTLWITGEWGVGEDKFVIPYVQTSGSGFHGMQTSDKINAENYQNSVVSFYLLSNISDCGYLSLYVQRDKDDFGEYVEFIEGNYYGELVKFDLSNALNRLGTKSFYLKFYWSPGIACNSSQYPVIDDLNVFGISGGSYDYEEGTSMAAPYVTGLAAILKSANSGYTYKDIKDKILNKVDKKSSLSDKVLTGGRINAYKSMDNVPPTATISYSTTKITNQNVVATLKPSESITVTNNGGLTEYTFTKNGSFTFNFNDAAGNTGSATAKISNIDKIAPTALISYSNTNSTNTNVVATLEPSEIVAVTNNSGSKTYTFAKNGSFTFYFKDSAGNKGSTTASVKNIDKIVPTAPMDVKVYSDSTKKVDLTDNFSHNFKTPYFNWTGATDNYSGINGYYVNLSTDITANAINGKFQTTNYITIKPLTNRDTYYLHIKTVDKAGNISKGIYVKYIFMVPKVLGAESVIENIVVGTHVGRAPHVRVMDKNGNLQSQFYAYDNSWRTGVNMAVGDVDGDGENEIITSPKGTSEPLIRIFNGNGEMEGEFHSFPSEWHIGSKIAVGDVDGDGTEEIIVIPAIKASAHIRIFDYQGNLKYQFFMFPQEWKLDLNIAAGDVNGDGKAEIVASTQAGYTPHVRMFNYQGELVGQFFAYAMEYRGGVNLAVGDTDGDGVDEIITGTGPGYHPHVRIIDYQNNVKGQFYAYALEYRGGLNLATADIDGNGSDEIITGTNPGYAPHVRCLDSQGNLISQFYAYKPEWGIGVVLAGGVVD